MTTAQRKAIGLRLICDLIDRQNRPDRLPAAKGFALGLFCGIAMTWITEWLLSL